jgi:tetratricopeptide (TPR) repeat protein
MKNIYPLLIICIFIGCATKGKENYDAGVKLFQEMKYRDCIPEFQKALDQNPDFGEAYMYMGRAYNLLQQYDQSIDAYQKALGIFRQGKFNASVENLPDNEKVKQIEEVWLPYSQLQQKIQRGIPLTDIEIQKQAEIIKRLNPK